MLERKTKMETGRERKKEKISEKHLNVVKK